MLQFTTEKPTPAFVRTLCLVVRIILHINPLCSLCFNLRPTYSVPCFRMPYPHLTLLHSLRLTPHDTLLRTPRLTLHRTHTLPYLYPAPSYTAYSTPFARLTPLPSSYRASFPASYLTHVTLLRIHTLPYSVPHALLLPSRVRFPTS